MFLLSVDLYDQKISFQVWSLCVRSNQPIDPCRFQLSPQIWNQPINPIRSICHLISDSIRFSSIGTPDSLMPWWFFQPVQVEWWASKEYVFSRAAKESTNCLNKRKNLSDITSSASGYPWRYSEMRIGSRNQLFDTSLRRGDLRNQMPSKQIKSTALSSHPILKVIYPQKSTSAKQLKLNFFYFDIGALPWELYETLTPTRFNCCLDSHATDIWLPFEI
jgi:hypothetical protein